MKLIVQELAARSIARTGVWVEKQNTEESGPRWINRVYEALEDQARTGVNYALCRNDILAQREYHCFTYNDKWVVAYRIAGSNFVVCRFILGSKLR